MSKEGYNSKLYFAGKPNSGLKRGRGVVSLSSALYQATKPAFVRKGFVKGRIIADWTKIVGQFIACNSNPVKVVYVNNTNKGILHIEVYDSAVVLELQYSQQMILEKIAVYFGYRAIDSIKLIQRPEFYKADSLQDDFVVEHYDCIKTDNKHNSILDDILGDIEDDELKNVLRSLGESVL